MHIDNQHDALEQLAYQSWLDRGQPMGSPEVDWAHAVALYNNRRRQALLSAPEQEGAPDTGHTPVLLDAVSAANDLASHRTSRSKVRARPKSISAASETPLEVPPSTPAPAPPTPTKATARV